MEEIKLIVILATALVGLGTAILAFLKAKAKDSTQEGEKDPAPKVVLTAGRDAKYLDQSRRYNLK